MIDDDGVLTYPCQGSPRGLLLRVLALDDLLVDRVALGVAAAGNLVDEVHDVCLALNWN